MPPTTKGRDGGCLAFGAADLALRQGVEGAEDLVQRAHHPFWRGPLGERREGNDVGKEDPIGQTAHDAAEDPSGEYAARRSVG